MNVVLFLLVLPCFFLVSFHVLCPKLNCPRPRPKQSITLGSFYLAPPVPHMMLLSTVNNTAQEHDNLECSPSVVSKRTLYYRMFSSAFPRVRTTRPPRRHRHQHRQRRHPALPNRHRQKLRGKFLRQKKRMAMMMMTMTSLTCRPLRPAGVFGESYMQ